MFDDSSSDSGRETPDNQPSLKNLPKPPFPASKNSTLMTNTKACLPSSNNIGAAGITNII